MHSHSKILLLYKNSTYASYFLNTQRPNSHLQGLFNSAEIRRFRKTHENHFWALSFVEAVLKDKGLKYTKICRGTVIDYSRFDFIITFGGDGTFLEAARKIKKQMIWGVNSDPTWSVGRFCSSNPRTFEGMLSGFLRNKFNTKIFNRLQLQFNDTTHLTHVLNDMLICHQSPGAMSRYYLKVGRLKEEQRSSGIWISTAAGSSGAIHSAGGKIIPDQSQLMQYRPRELYTGKNSSYTLKGGLLKPTQTISVTSLIREGVVFIDGSHVSAPFSFGRTLKVSRSPYPLKVVWS